ncbi:MAG: ribonuclease H family protein [Bacteroidales bacterium]|nr:ribonuclease H family protein [Bacteroidales bacterium]
MAKQKKYYVVWSGHQPGIYEDWETCQKQLKGFEYAQFKSFLTREQAEKAFWDDPDNYIGKEIKREMTEAEKKIVGTPILESLSVDASCLGNPGKLEYRCVHTQTKQVIFNRGPYELGTVNIGEFLAIVLALVYEQKHNIHVPIYSDSKTALSWVRQKQVKTQLPRIAQNEILFEQLEKAVAWLNNNTIQTKLLKWQTEFWGEIPADYDRK